ncbi:hypothetical protein F5876DRAFT_68845 [Lentinula aff. lateritia]|uniref:Uncharacterized protein n=1 Tax=Lentinula aff. lateritia TaxID=2804960 RepID=A0ACC1TQ03_9AGAR|nr:hypothetical protein F5876DRAFT_68845 [Lentinula aff. lateritia]
MCTRALRAVVVFNFEYPLLALLRDEGQELGPNQQLEGQLENLKQSILVPLASTPQIKYSDRVQHDETSREIQDDPDPTVRMSISAPAGLESLRCGTELRRRYSVLTDLISPARHTQLARIEGNLKVFGRDSHSSDVPDSDTKAQEHLRPLSRSTAARPPKNRQTKATSTCLPSRQSLTIFQLAPNAEHRVEITALRQIPAIATTIICGTRWSIWDLLVVKPGGRLSQLYTISFPVMIWWSYLAGSTGSCLVSSFRRLFPSTSQLFQNRESRSFTATSEVQFDCFTDALYSTFGLQSGAIASTIPLSTSSAWNALYHSGSHKRFREDSAIKNLKPPISPALHAVPFSVHLHTKEKGHGFDALELATQFRIQTSYAYGTFDPLESMKILTWT